MSYLSMDSQRLIIGVLITLTGEIDSTNVDELEDYLGSRRIPGEPLVLDLGGVTFMDGRGLRLLLSLDATQREQGAALHVTSVRRLPARLLRVTGVWRALSIHASVEEAIVRMLDDQATLPSEPA
ncbi:STAS domain-containing protein [Nonomuraea sp. NN258]|uniref:STAS domain-containing protein n=1 Tax=Nonomuraea antri TaxID=2730852 RepID=UPI00156939C3|nr:STAS domain-containing protein [Nonomuraea antri]NRQ37326.1 STAS domain-containing protein [Nonomuraea antri]